MNIVINFNKKEENLFLLVEAALLFLGFQRSELTTSKAMAKRKTTSKPKYDNSLLAFYSPRFTVQTKEKQIPNYI